MKPTNIWIKIQWRRLDQKPVQIHKQKQQFFKDKNSSSTKLNYNHYTRQHGNSTYKGGVYNDAITELKRRFERSQIVIASCLDKFE